MKDEVFRMEEIKKSFENITVFDNFHLNLFRGEMLAIAGLSGSGRKTLAKIISGQIKADSGRIFLEEELLSNGTNKKDDNYNDIFHIKNKTRLLANLTVKENLLLNNSVQPYSIGRVLINWKGIYKHTAKLLKQFNLNISPDTKVEHLPFATCLKLELIKAYINKAKVVVFDPLLEQLNDHELLELYQYIYSMKEYNMSFIIMIGQKKINIDYFDRVVLLKHGMSFKTVEKSEMADSSFLDWLLDKSNNINKPPSFINSKKLTFKMANIRSSLLSGLSLNLYAGEILGIFSEYSNVTDEFMKILKGENSNYEGQMHLNYKVYSPRNMSDASKMGVLFTENNSLSSEIFDNLSISENIALSSWNQVSIGPFIRKSVPQYLEKEFFNSLNLDKSLLNKKISELPKLDIYLRERIYLYRWGHVPVKLWICNNLFYTMDSISKGILLDAVYKKAKSGTAIIIISNSISNLDFCNSVLYFDKDFELKTYNSSKSS